MLNIPHHPPEKHVARTVSIPKSVDQKMRQTRIPRVNWSKVAAEAFANVLKEIANGRQ